MVSRLRVDSDWRRSRRMLLLILAVCLVPVLIAYGLYFFKPAWMPTRSTNHGQLMEPLRTLPALNLHDAQGTAVTSAAFKGHWNLLYIGSTQCDALCAKRAYEVSNILVLLRSSRSRLEVFYIAPDQAALQRSLAALQPIQASQLQRLSAGSPSSKQAAAVLARPPGSVLLIDPIGDWVLSYPADGTPKDIYLDLRHLLRYSHIG